MKIIQAKAVNEGAGVTVHRTIGTSLLRNLDPFLMLDHFGSEDPDEYIAGFPDHPHRGFITFTYMLDGQMLHRDSMGNRGHLNPGGVQWMKAASGVIHSEMPRQSHGLIRGFQLWINLPAKEKMSAPAYQEYAAESIPFINRSGVEIQLLIGDYGKLKSPISDPHTDVQYLDMAIQPDESFEHQVESGYRGFIYLFEGAAKVNGHLVENHSLVVLDDNKRIQIGAAEKGARMIFVSGRPINEPIVQQGPFVMNSNEEIHQAMRDYRDSRLVQTKASMNNY